MTSSQESDLKKFAEAAEADRIDKQRPITQAADINRKSEEETEEEKGPNHFIEIEGPGDIRH